MLSRRHALSVLLATAAGGAAAAVGNDSPTAEKKQSCAVPGGVPKTVFQLSNADDTALVLRVAANYLLAAPNAEVTVVGYNGGGEFMLKDARDATGKLYSEQINRLADRGVKFKACNNWLKSRSLTPDALVAAVTVVPSGVIEILRLQNDEGFAYFRP